MTKQNFLIILLFFASCHVPGKSKSSLAIKPPVSSPPVITSFNDTFHYKVVNGVFLKRQYPDHIEFDGVVIEDNWGTTDSIIVIRDREGAKLSRLISTPDSSRFKFKKKH